MNAFSAVLLAVLIGASVVSQAVPLSAHHAFAAEFDAKKPVTLEGTLTHVRWVNPHGWIYVDAAGPDGRLVNWAIEFGSPVSLLRRGLRVTDFPPGMKLTIKGFLARNGTPTINAESVTLPNGRSLYAGSSNPNAQGSEP